MPRVSSWLVTKAILFDLVHNTTKGAYRVPFISHGTRRLTVPFPAQKEAYSIRSRESQLPPASGEGADTPACYKNAPHHSQVLHLPLAPDKCVNKQIPSLTDVEHNGYGNKKVKRIKTQENWAKEKKNS